jgi:LysR family transcriptional regulator, nitrogen assimilation regulatory protein
MDAGGKLPPPLIVANSMSIMRQAINSGLAHSIMPWGAIAEDLKAGTLKATPLEPVLERRVHLCVARDAMLSLAGAAVLTLFEECVRERVANGFWQGVRLAQAQQP